MCYGVPPGKLLEFCSVDAGILAQGNGYIFLFEAQKKYCIETEKLMWRRLDQLGVVPGTSLYSKGVRVRKTRPVAGFDIACKWKQNYQGLPVKDAWFILTDLGSRPVAIAAYKQRMGIEESYLDCKTGGYNIEGTGLREERLIKMILLMAIAYTSAIFQGAKIKKNRCKNIYPAVNKQGKNTDDGVHLVWSGWRSVGKLS